VIALVGLMLGARRAQAALVVLLSALATAAAVAGPVYTAAVDRAAAAAEVERTPVAERTVEVRASVESTMRQRFDLVANELADLPRFDTVLTASMPVLGLEAGGAEPSFLTFRDRVCAHLEIVAGRCLMGSGEIVVGAATAERLGVTPGRPVPLAWGRYDDLARRWIPAGEPSPLVVVGVYRPRDPAAAYWGRTGWFAPTMPDAVAEPVFTGRPSIDAVAHDLDNRSVEAIPAPDALTADHLPEVAAALDALAEEFGGDTDTSAFVTLTNDLPGLFARVDRSGELTRRIVPLAGLPLIGLCWLVIFLAVAGATAARRHEQALIALRGAPRAGRWWLAAGESAVAIAVGAPIGYVAGTLAVRAVAGARFGPVPVLDLAPPPGALTAALVAVAGAVAAGLLALRRDLGSPVVDLLRRVPPARAAWRTAALDAGAVLLAVIAAVQLRAFDGQLLGLGLLVPGLIALAVAVLAGRLLVPVAARAGRRALRRGRLGPGLGALQLARRPGGQRLFVLLAVAVALLGFAVTAADVDGRARADRAAVETGAVRTLRVGTVDSGTLRAATRAVDPGGRFAMAVGVAPGVEGPSVLFADTAALPAVALWRPEYGERDAAATAAALAPPPDDPIVLHGTRLLLTVERGEPETRGTTLRATVLLWPLRGGAPIRTGDEVPVGRHTLELMAPGCADGCRLAAVEVRYDAGGGQAADVTLRSLGVRTVAAGPATAVVPAFTGAGWRTDDGSALADAAGGVRVVVPGAVVQPRPTAVVPADTPTEVPALAGGAAPRSGEVDGLDGNPVPVRVVGTGAALPRIGAGVLMDLAYAERVATGATTIEHAEVWLGPAAPPDVERRLAEHGLVVVGRDSAAAAAQRLDQRGPALAVWFHLLAGGVAVLLAAGGMALMAAVDRRRTLDDLVALRRQGLAARTGGRWVLWAYLPLAAGAVVAGLAAAGVAWWVAGGYVPHFVDDDFPLAVPAWPRPLAVTVPAVVVTLLFTSVAVGLRRALRVRD